MSDYTNTPIGSGYNTSSAINTELQKAETAINSKVNESGATMTGDLDLNSNNIVNLPDATTAQEPATYSQLLGLFTSSNFTSADAKFVDTMALATADTSLTTGQVLVIKDRANGIFDVISGTGTADTYSIVAHDTLSISLSLRKDGSISPTNFGAATDGTTDATGAWNAWVASTGTKVVTTGSYLVSAVVKIYDTPTFVNTVNSNHAAGYLALELNATGENNTAIGSSALKVTNGVLPLGSNNVAVGKDALQANTEGYRSVAVGYQSCFSNTGNLVFGNSLAGLGYQTLFNNIEGKDNTALGYLSMFFNEGGGGNTAIGYRSLYTNVGTTSGNPSYAAIDGSFNTSTGYESMLLNVSGNSNTANGWRAMYSNTTGTRNTSLGQEALRNNTTSSNNTAVGYKALNVSNGADNVAVGYQALLVNTAGTNTAVGKDAMLANTSGLGNTAIGYQALDANITSNFCTAIGRGSLSASTGNNNTSIGYNAGVSITSAISCTALGFTALLGNSTFSNCTGVGNNSAVTAANQVQLGDSATTTYVYGTVQNRSDKRDKAEIRDTELGLDFINSVRAVDYKWDLREDYDGEKDGSKVRSRFHHGVIAQELPKNFGGLQHHEKSGGEDVYSVGYDEFISPLIKAVQELTKKNQELEYKLEGLINAS